MCWSSSSVNADGTLKLTLGGTEYNYPANYGFDSCATHDTGRQPYCNVANPPDWCADSWCYVDKDCNVGIGALHSSYFPGLTYSYATCDSSNSFSSWFGENAGADGSHSITDLASLLTTYLKSIINTLEVNKKELSSSSSPTCSADSGCPCTTCEDTPSWGTDLSSTPAGQTVRADMTTFTLDHGDGVQAGSDTAKQEKCLVSTVGNSFLRVAAKEVDVTSRVGYEYYGSQSVITWGQWPGMQFCLGSWDYRFRPWYAAAAAGPKDIVIVIDTSGSMSGGKMDMAIAAGVKVLSTLTDSDYVSVVDFSSNAVAYSDTLVQATGCASGCTDPTGNIQPHGNLGNIKTFIEGLQATGTTNFNAAFDKAWAIFRSGGPSSNCNKILLFLTDGEPNNPWGDSENAEVKSNAAALDVHVMTYALGSGADSTVTKKLACDSRGISYKIPDGDSTALGDAMAGYYSLLSPMLTPCQTRWITYNDVITGTKLLAACMAGYEMLDGSTATSCEGGLQGLGEAGDARTPKLLGVGCIDMNLVVSMNVLEGRTDYTDFQTEMERQSKLCPRATVTEAQLDTLREAVSIDAICDPDRAVAAESSGGSVGGNSTDADAAIVGAAIGGAVGGVLLIGCIAFACCFMKGRAGKPPPQAAARNCGTAAAVNQYTQPGVQMAQAPVVQGFAVGGTAVPMGQAVA
jgi:uncharacterized protein YegL